MDINLPPEFDSVVQSYLMPATKELKQLELTRRLVRASAARTEKEKIHIMQLSTAFSYVIHVTAGIVTVERKPPEEEDEVANSIVLEMQPIIKTIFPEKMNVAMGTAKPELADIFRAHIMQIIGESLQSLGGVSQ